jgi:hypothetical protein
VTGEVVEVLEVVQTGPIQWVVTGLCAVSRWVSLSFILPRPFRWSGHLEENVIALHVYVLAWFGGLLAILLCGPVNGGWSLVLVGVAFYRLQDFVMATLDQALALTGKRNWTGGSSQAPVLIALVNIGQLVLIFAIAYQILIGDPAIGSSFTGPPLQGHFGHLVLSWRCVPPLGNGYVPTTMRARVLTMIESGSALLMITITLSRFLKKS